VDYSAVVIATPEVSNSNSHLILQPPPGLIKSLFSLPRALPGLLEFNAAGIICFQVYLQLYNSFSFTIFFDKFESAFFKLSVEKWIQQRIKMIFRK
jgi:hypothetical protein